MTTPAKFGGSIKNGPHYYREYTVTSYLCVYNILGNALFKVPSVLQDRIVLSTCTCVNVQCNVQLSCSVILHVGSRRRWRRWKSC